MTSYLGSETSTMAIPHELLFGCTTHDTIEDDNLTEYIEKTLTEHEQGQLKLTLHMFIAGAEKAWNGSCPIGTPSNLEYYRKEMEKIKRFYFEAGMNEVRTNIADHGL